MDRYCTNHSTPRTPCGNDFNFNHSRTHKFNESGHKFQPPIKVAAEIDPSSGTLHYKVKHIADNSIAKKADENQSFYAR